MPPRTGGRRAAWIPLGISVGAHALFFIQYWIPETGAFPARDWWLTQLSPLVSTALTSRGQPQVPAQETQAGIAAIILLIAAFALYWLSRTRVWWGRTAMVLPAAVGLLAVLGTIITLLVAGQLANCAVGVLLMLCWVLAAAYAAAQGLQDHLGPVPVKTAGSGLVLLVVYAILGPAPTAVGRWLFAPELRDAAAVLQGNTVALRLSALWTPTTWLLYLCGLLVGATVWVAYQWWPPRREQRFAGLSLALVGLVIITGAVGLPTATMAAKRVTTLHVREPQQRDPLQLRLVGPGPTRGPGPARAGPDDGDQRVHLQDGVDLLRLSPARHPHAAGFAVPGDGPHPRRPSDRRQDRGGPVRRNDRGRRQQPDRHHGQPAHRAGHRRRGRTLAVALSDPRRPVRWGADRGRRPARAHHSQRDAAEGRGALRWTHPSASIP